MMRGANCWTDHKLVRAKLMADLSRAHRAEKRMMPFSVHKLSTTNSRDEYKKCVARLSLQY